MTAEHAQRVARAHAGADLCRAAIAQQKAATHGPELLDPDDPIRDRALRRARAERRAA